jgi:hypothetical protein
VIDAERTLLQVQLEYERALVERAERLAEVEMLVGRPLTQAGQPAPDGASGNSAEPETVTD